MSCNWTTLNYLLGQRRRPLVCESKALGSFQDLLALSLPLVGHVEVYGESSNTPDDKDMRPNWISERSLNVRQLTHPIDTQIAVIYLGASGCLTMKLPAIPPAPLKAVTAAAVNTRFHCPTMLFA